MIQNQTGLHQIPNLIPTDLRQIQTPTDLRQIQTPTDLRQIQTRTGPLLNLNLILIALHRIPNPIRIGNSVRHRR
jgi:hypothetical protein